MNKKILWIFCFHLFLLTTPYAFALNVQSFRPQTGATSGLHLLTSETLPKFRLATGLFINYDHHPLEVRTGQGPYRAVVDQLVTGDFLFTYGFLDWLTLHLDIPVNFYHNIAPVLIPTRDLGGGDMGDILVQAKIRLVNPENNPAHFGLSVAPFLTFPTGPPIDIFWR